MLSENYSSHVSEDPLFLFTRLFLLRPITTSKLQPLGAVITASLKFPCFQIQYKDSQTELIRDSTNFIWWKRVQICAAEAIFGTSSQR